MRAVLKWDWYNSRAQALGIGRTIVVMCSWIMDHAPEYGDQIAAGTAKVTPIYRRLKREYDAKCFRAICEQPSDGARLVCRRENGEFVFEWVEQ